MDTNMFNLQTTRSKPIYKHLEENYGGKWTYDRSSKYWFCNDNKRYAHYVSNNFYNEYWEDENANPPSLYIYGGDKPILVFL